MTLSDSVLTRALRGVALVGHTMRARMKPEDPRARGIMPGDAVPAVAPGFTSSFAAAGGPGGEDAWLHSLSAAQSLTVAAGDYLFDSSLLLDGTVVWTSDPVRIVLRNAASASP